MENKNFDQTEKIFQEYIMTSVEMMAIRGGEDGEPIVIPNPPRPKI